MAGLFQALEIGKRALLTHQLSMTTIGHNVANVNTPGYTRQKTRVTAAQAIELAAFNIGNGVTVDEVYQVRDLFLTDRFRRENKSLGQWSFQEKMLTQIETFFAEPSEDSLGNILDQFWESWSALSNDPELQSARTAVISQSETLVNAFHSLDGQLRELHDAADKTLETQIGEINRITGQIADLNHLIVGEELGGQKANDLRDSRDYLIDELSKLVDVTTREEPSGSVNVYISGLAIVENADTFELGTKINSAGKQVKRDIIWKHTDTQIRITGGELKGILVARDEIIPDCLNQLDDLAATIVSEVNSLHRAGTDLNGMTGLNFFNSAYADAGTIRLETSIEDDPSKIAASLSGEPGDNANALAIHALRYELVMSDGKTNIAGFYNSMISSIGVSSNEAKTYKGNFEVMIQQIENSRQSVQGVSLDEEMAEMVRMEHAFNAAARLITFIDEALGDLIQGMGVVGR
jgi:flagellar hook-associated protein 1 FlgK